MWDFLFYLLFGLVVTSSAAIAGVLLVFCFLIVPAIIGSLFSGRPAVALAIGWAAGVAASAAGLWSSFAWDLPAGAALIIAFAAVLLFAGALRALAMVPAALRLRRLSLLGRAACAGTLAVTAAAMLWLIALPRADQPVVSFVEHIAGVGPDRFLTADERLRLAQAATSARLKHSQADASTMQERQARWQGDSLSDDAIRQLGSYQQAFNEMARGDDFVARELIVRAREREREREAPFLLALSVVGLVSLLRPQWTAWILARSFRRRRLSQRT